jgi:hypothetical protein
LTTELVVCSEEELNDDSLSKLLDDSFSLEVLSDELSSRIDEPTFDLLLSLGCSEGLFVT